MSEVVAKPDFPPLRLLLLIALWLLFLAWTFAGIVLDPVSLGTVPPGTRVSAPYQTLLISLNFWGFAAGLVLAFIGFNPFGWLNGKRLVLGCMAFAVVLGRLGGGWLVSGLTSITVPEVTILLGTPFVLLFGGIGVILAVSLVAFLLFYFFVAVPVTIFNQVFAFERALGPVSS